MVTYYLLRNNQESGPFSLREIKEMPLFSTDLVWVNGESTSWKNPEEIEGLKGLAKEPALQKTAQKIHSASTLRTVTRTTVSGQLSGENPLLNSAYPQGEGLFDKPSFEALKEKHARRPATQKIWKRQLNIGANLIGLTTLIVGVMVAAFMIKKAVDNLEPEPMLATADAVEIGGTVHVHSASQTAMAPIGTGAGEEVAGIIEMETHPSEVPPVKGEEGNQEAVPGLPERAKKDTKRAELSLSNEGGNADSLRTLAKENGQPAADENESEAASMAEINEEKKTEKPALTLTASEFKKGLLGGISNLELTVTNPGSGPVNKAVVEVEYLKPNGKVVGTQIIEVNDIAPNSSKKVAVPDHSRGVNVRYRVLTVDAG